ncbi:MAG: hypothetical protein ACKOAD_02795 [Gammaproteobacteria bacterium]
MSQIQDLQTIQNSADKQFLALNWSLPLKRDEDKEDESESGETGSGGMLWSSSGAEEEEFLELLSPDQFMMLEKMVKAMISQGQAKFGNKAVSKLMKQQMAKLYLDSPSQNAAKNSGGGSTQKHPLLADASGLRAKISPNWQNDNDAKAKSGNKNQDKLLNKLKNKLANAPKLQQIAKPDPKQKLEIRYREAPKLKME